MKVIALLACLMVLTSVAPVMAREQPNNEIVVEKFVHYVAPPRVTTDENDKSYKLFRGGIKWSALPVTYHVDPDGAPAGAVSEVEAAFETWDTVVQTENLFDPAIENENAEPSLNIGVMDHINTVTWGPILDNRVIAVTYFAYYRRTRELVEFDIIFNDNLAWGIDQDGEGTIAEFDVRNIATHEAGHTLVLDDLYRPKARELTMYGYSVPGETKKISLGLGDNLGIQKLYA